MKIENDGKYETICVGRYNIDYCGLAWDKESPYQMIIIQEFNKDESPINDNQILYIKLDIQDTKRFSIDDVLPDLSSEEKIEAYMSLPKYSKLKVIKQEVEVTEIIQTTNEMER